jgi:recombinational DNA repair protein RecR
MTGSRILPTLDDSLNSPVIDIICSTEETETRLGHCKKCDQFTHSSGATICATTQCNISLMTTMKFKMCPKEFWQ